MRARIGRLVRWAVAMGTAGLLAGCYYPADYGYGYAAPAYGPGYATVYPAAPSVVIGGGYWGGGYWGGGGWGPGWHGPPPGGWHGPPPPGGWSGGYHPPPGGWQGGHPPGGGRSGWQGPGSHPPGGWQGGGGGFHPQGGGWQGGGGGFRGGSGPGQPFIR